MTYKEDVYHFSNSEVTTFQGCPRKWWLAWYRGLTPRAVDVQGPRSTGTRIHLALAEYYHPRIFDTLISPGAHAKEMLSAAQFADISALRAAYADDEDLNLREAKLQSDFDLERIMLEGYLEWVQETGIDAELEVVGVEQNVEVDYLLTNVDRVKLVGKIDARVRSRITGRRKFIDHKTVQSVHDRTLKMNRQMKHYHLLEDLISEPDAPRADGALYNMLRKVKRTGRAVPPFYARVPIEHNRHEIENYRMQLESLMLDILDRTTKLRDGWGSDRHQIYAPARVSRECTWCPFLKICPMFDDGSRVEAAIEDLYQVGDPLSYYGANEKETETREN